MLSTQTGCLKLLLHCLSFEVYHLETILLDFTWSLLIPFLPFPQLAQLQLNIGSFS